MARVKKEMLRESRSRNVQIDSNSKVSADNNQNNINNNNQEEDEVVIRRNLRSKYLAVKNLIGGENDDSSTPDSDKFRSIFNEVENLHKQVQKPREQVADAEALLDIASSFVKSVKAQRNEGATPSDLVSCLLRDFGRHDRSTSSSVDGARNLILWKDIGLAVSHIFKKGAGCSTMLGPMNAELKIRKNTVRKKHVKPTEMARPEELNNVSEEKTDTDKNMLTMFGVLRKYRKVRLENVVLNRTSFAQTVENLFALSFLVKDGRAEIAANAYGHFVCPRNAPDAKAVESGKVCYGHFVFRFDFKDWKVMLDSVPEGEELMPHRVQVEIQPNTSTHSMPVEPDIETVITLRRKASTNQGTSQLPDLAEDSRAVEPDTAAVSTPIRKLCRNRGLVFQEQTVVEDSPESDDNISRASYIRKGKRKIM